MLNDKKILILIGKGKTTLSKFIQKASHEGASAKVLYGVDEANKASATIKIDCASGFRHIIELESPEEIKKLSEGLVRRAVVFKIEPLL